MTQAYPSYALQPEDKRHEFLLGFIEKMPGLKEELETDVNAFMENDHHQAEPPTSIALLHILSTLIQRKDELFPNDDRIIMDFKVRETPEAFIHFINDTLSAYTSVLLYQSQ